MKPSTSGWFPFLAEDGGKDEAEAAVRAIAEAVKKKSLTPGSSLRSSGTEEGFLDPSLALGGMGFAVFFAHLHRCFPEEDYGVHSEALLEACAESLSREEMSPWLFLGFPGIAWGLTHVDNLLGKTDRYDCSAIDEVLEESLSRSPWGHHFDLTYGLVGLGIYALERLPRPRAKGCLEKIVDRLEEIALPDSGGMTWHSPPEYIGAPHRRQFPEGYFNLGLAHGVPGIISLLAAVSNHGISAGQVRSLVEGAVAWLLAQEFAEPTECRFPSLIAPSGERPRARTAWCYGDPGIAIALLRAGRAFENSEWEKEGLKTAERALRRPRENTGVVDAGLCHGAAGLAHLFASLAHATGERELATAARSWYSETLAMRGEKDPAFGGYSFLCDEGEGEGWVPQPGFLVGAAGVGLALLAGIAEEEPTWDALLLTSLRERGTCSSVALKEELVGEKTTGA